MDIRRLTWDKGLVTSVFPTFLPDGALSAGEDFRTVDGATRLDQRYINKAEVSSGSRTTRGSGWGKFGANEEYLHVSNTAMYFAATPAASAWTAVTGAGAINGSDWMFQQFGQYMYAANAVDGIGRKVIGTNSFSLLSIPTAPVTAPTAPVVQPPYDDVSYVGGTATNSGLASSTIDGTGRLVGVSSTAGAKSMTITFDTSPDERPNHQYRDVVTVQVVAFGYPVGTFPSLTVIEGGVETEAIIWKTDPVAGTITYRFQNIARGSRDVVTAWRFEWTAPAGTNIQMIIYPGRAYGVWLSLDVAYNPGSGLPIFPVLKYEMTFYNSTTGFESAPSPVLNINSNAQGPLGDWRTVTGYTSAQSGVDFVRFYRVVDNAGVLTRYRLASVANSGTPSYVDKLSLDEVLALTIFSPSILPTTGITAITAWQNRMALAVGTLCYISQEDDELKFESASGAYDPFNPSRGLTFYPDDKKAESFIAAVGQDDLYLGSGYSVRALIGNTPDNWRLIKLPDIEGICGSRAMCAYKKGILALTPSGRLLYHHSSLSEPVDVGANIRARPGENGLVEMATSDACVGVTPDGEIWITNQAGRYFVRDLDGSWRRGTFTHGIHSLLFVSGLALRWMGANGKLYEGGEDSYVTDGGTNGTNGTAKTFSAHVARLTHARSRVDHLYFGDAGGTSPFPRITVYSQETPAGTVYSKTSGLKNKRTKLTDRPIGEWSSYKLEGDKDTVFDDVRVALVDLSPARNK